MAMSAVWMLHCGVVRRTVTCVRHEVLVHRRQCPAGRSTLWSCKPPSNRIATTADEVGQVGESALAVNSDSTHHPGLQHAASDEPTPEHAAMVGDEFERLLGLLKDETLRAIVMLKLDGYTNMEVAEQLNRHVRSIERKLQLIRMHWSKDYD